ncbi:MAG: hypothetical protein IT195_04875 [Microthrixaceae bacterium]|nr:hypothetical protein [Microthrixaceae bacterium]
MTEPSPADTDDIPSDDEVVDALPEDLDATAAVPVTFPNNSRRRIPAVLYLLMGGAAIAVSVVAEGTASANAGLAVGGGILCLFALYGLAAGRALRIDECEALVVAATKLGYPVGHASAQMSWRGLLSRPVWRLLIYSSEDQPLRRAMVVVDGVTGEVVEWFSEDNPEDWSAFAS